MSQRMSAAEWIKQKELERKGIRMPSRQMAPPMQALSEQLIAPITSANSSRLSSQVPVVAPIQSEEQISGPAAAIARGIKASIEAQQEGLRRNAFIARPANAKPVRLSAIPSPEMKKIQASVPGFYQIDANTYYKSPTGKIHYIPSPRKPSPDEKIFPLFERGNKVVDTRTNTTGTIEVFRKIERNIPYYSVNYDDGTFLTWVEESNLLREN